MAAVCVFCCTNLNVIDNCEGKVEDSDEEKILKTFLKVIQSHFAININKVIEQNHEDFLEEVKACLKCEESLKLICQLYRELEGIRLKLEWDFGELIEKVEAVGNTPSKVKWLGRNQSVNEFKKLADFRHNFISEGNQSLAKSKPLVILQRAQGRSQLNKLLIEKTIKIEEDDDDQLLDHFSDYVEVNIDDKLVEGFGDQNDEKYFPVSEQSPLSSSISQVTTELGDSENKTEVKTTKRIIKKPFKCPYCPKCKYSERRNLLRHQRTCHAELIGYRKRVTKLPNEKPFKCPHCPIGRYSERRNLLRHERTHHADIIGYQKTTKLPLAKPFKCSSSNCSSSFTHRKDLLRHQRKRHADPDPYENDKKLLPAKKPEPLPPPLILPVMNDNKNQANSEPSAVATTTQLPTRKPFKCPHCPLKYSHRCNLRRHHRTFHADLPDNHTVTTTTIKPPIKKSLNYKCSHCSKAFAQRSNLLSHQRNRHTSLEDLDPTTVIKCTHTNCSAIFRNRRQLRRHKSEVHDKIPKTTCPICGRVCTLFCNLKFHMKTQHDDESPELPIACNVDPECPKRFPTEDILEWHRKYYYHYKREDPVEIVNCPECNRECQGKPGLKTHMKIHRRPEAPYVCELCGAAFKNKCILREHGWFHKGPDNWAFQCEECGKRCATKFRLSDHLKVHSDVRMYSCEACGKGFKGRQSLRDHVNKFHVEEGSVD